MRRMKIRLWGATLCVATMLWGTAYGESLQEWLKRDKQELEQFKHTGSTQPAHAAPAARTAGKSVLIPMPFEGQVFGTCWAADIVMLVKAYSPGNSLTFAELVAIHQPWLLSNETGKYGIQATQEAWGEAAKEANERTPGHTIRYLFQDKDDFDDLPNTLAGILDKGSPAVLAVSGHALLVVGYRRDSKTGEYIFTCHDSRANPFPPPLSDSAYRDGQDGCLYWERRWSWFESRAKCMSDFWTRIGLKTSPYDAHIVYATGPPAAQPLQSLCLPVASEAQADRAGGLSFRARSKGKPTVSFYPTLDPKRPTGLVWAHRRHKPKPCVLLPRETIPAEANEFRAWLHVWNTDRVGASHNSVRFRIFPAPMSAAPLWQDETEGFTVAPCARHKVALDFPTVERFRKHRPTPTQYILFADLLDADDHRVDGFQIDFALDPLPSVLDVTPGKAAPGDVITINGKNFGKNEFGAGRVQFGSADAPINCIVEWTDTRIRVRVPDSAQSGDLLVTLNESTSVPVPFEVLAALSGVVAPGDRFDVSFPLPPDARGARGDWHWVLMDKNRRLEYVDLPMLRKLDHHTPATIGQDRMRTDIASVSEHIAAGKLTATLQLTDVCATNFLGEQMLVGVFVPPVPKTVDEAGATESKVIQAAITSLTSDQALSWLDKKKAYEKSLQGSGLSESAVLDLCAEQGLTCLKEFGARVSPVYMPDKTVRRKIVVGSITADIPAPPQWKETDSSCQTYMHERSSTLVREKEDFIGGFNQMPVVALYASAKVAFLDAPSLPKQFAARHQGVAGERQQQVKAGPFSGVFYVREEKMAEDLDTSPKLTGPQAERRSVHKITGEALLTCGKLYLYVTSHASVVGLSVVKFTGQQYHDGVLTSVKRELLHDARPKVQPLASAVLTELHQIVTSPRLLKHSAGAKAKN